MEKLLYFDICALIILVILITSTLFRNMLRGKVNCFFFALLILSLITTGFDIWAIALDNAGAGNLTFKYVAHTFYLLFHNLTTPLYIFYIIALSDTWHIIRRKIIFPILLFMPFAIDIILLISNLFIHKLFYFDANDTYTRGSIYFIIYIIAAIYFLFGFIYLTHYRMLFSIKKFSSLIAVFPLMLFATIVQMLYPAIRIEMFVHSACLLYICMMVQRPEERLDMDSGLQNLSSYVNDINHAVLTKKQNRIIMINITNYEVVRKMLGYENNIKMLKAISEKLSAININMLLQSDLYYLGSGKFRVVTDLIPYDMVYAAAEMINETLKPNLTINQMEINLIACVCIVNYPEDIKDAESLLAFENELNGRYYNGNVLLAADIYQQSHYEIMKDIDRIIEHALTNNEFEVYYQPIYSVADNCFKSAEALLRLHTQDGKFISPELFIPAAEKSGAIHKIGVFVLEQVCDFIASDDFKKLHLNYIEVNLSVSQCMQSGLAGDVLDIIKKYKIETSRINLEITETAASYSQNTMLDNLNILSDAGISLSLDDFGTGYSNMMRIASLPLRIVKLDKTFSDISEYPNMSVVLENTIRMIKEMNMQIVVEGVETEQLADKFSELECEFIQGFYYSKPMPKDKLIAFLKESAYPSDNH